MRDAFAKALYAAAKEDPSVVIVTADISAVGSMMPFREEFPGHFINAGVAEQSMIGICAGLALRGLRPFAYAIAPFSIYRPFEQIRDDLCCQNLAVTVVGVGAGISYSLLGATHHTQEDIAVMGALPNLTILAPCDPLETEAAVWACARSRGPVYLRLGKAGEPCLTAEAEEPFRLGKLRAIRKGKEICILSYGPILRLALDAAEKFKQEKGLSAAVVSVHTLKPLDEPGIAAIMKTFETVIVLEEHSARGGLAAQVKQIGWDNHAPCRLRTFGLRDAFIHGYGSQADLWRMDGISLENICQ